MITMIGTGHLFRISEQISFIVKHNWPDAVLVELDERRYAAMTGEPGGVGSSENHSKLNRELAEYQKKIWENSGPRSEDDMLTAIHAGKAIGAQIICIDRDAEQTMSEVEENMSFLERTRFYFSLRRGKMSGAKSMGSMQKQLDANEEEYMRKLRKRFPTFVEKLIDERNTIMAARIKEAAEKYKNIVIVVGDGHVKGICELLDGIKIDKIRLADMMDQERMNEVRSRIWNRKAEESE